MKFLAVTILLAAASLSEGQSTTTKAGGTGANNSIPGLSEVEEKVKSAMEKVMEVSLDNANKSAEDSIKTLAELIGPLVSIDDQTTSFETTLADGNPFDVIFTSVPLIISTVLKLGGMNNGGKVYFQTLAEVFTELGKAILKHRNLFTAIIGLVYRIIGTILNPVGGVLRNFLNV